MTMADNVIGLLASPCTEDMELLQVLGFDAKIDEEKGTLVFNKEELEKSLKNITPKEAFRWIAIGNGLRHVMDMLKNLSKIYGVEIPQKAIGILKQASKEFTKVPVPRT